MSNGNGHQWSKFWWRDHQGDAALRACSLTARGYWMELLCIAHEAERVGYVMINGRTPTSRQLAAVAGCTERDGKRLEAELEAAGVFSRTPDGTIYCRRMVRDAAVSAAGREHIQKRWNGTTLTDPPNSPPIREGNSPPTRGASSPPISPSFPLDSLSSPTEAEAEAEPPLGPPQSRGGRRGAAKPHRNGFVELDRRLAAAAGERSATIEASAAEVAEFHEFSSRLRLVAGGEDG